MRGMRLQIYAEVHADLFCAAYGENPLSEVSGMWKTKLAEESYDIGK